MRRRQFVRGIFASASLLVLSRSGQTADRAFQVLNTDKSGIAPKAAPLKAPSLAAKSGHSDIVGKVSADRLYAAVKRLQQFETRLSGTQDNNEAGDWLDSQFQTHGHANGKGLQQPFDLPSGSKTTNRLFYPLGEASSYILVCAHYDSTSQEPMTSAPGADDNATGVAVLLEISQALAGVKLQKGVILACFSGEEQGLLGSQVCADIAAKEGWRIDLVLNLDMVGFADSNPPNIVVEYDSGNLVAENDEAAARFGATLSSLAKAVGGFSVKNTNIWNSDYMPFEAKGYPCVGLYDDGAEQPFYHSTGDTIANVNKDKLAGTARTVLATILEVGILTT